MMDLIPNSDSVIIHSRQSNLLMECTFMKEGAWSWAQLGKAAEEAWHHDTGRTSLAQRAGH